MSTTWSLQFLQDGDHSGHDRALIVLNQPLNLPLLSQLWPASGWRCFADGGANRVHDIFPEPGTRNMYLPDLIKGDLDSIRPDVRAYYSALGIPIVHDPDQYSTDLMKCVAAAMDVNPPPQEIVLLGGLSGRLDQTIHTLSFLHKMRAEDVRIYAVTPDNVGWVLDGGEHTIDLSGLHGVGPTCGLLPVGIDSTVLTTRGLRWNLDEKESSFDGMVSTSNQLDANEVYVKTSRPIWWCVELGDKWK
ncbi:thiamine pyrophosphokinase [Rickenella mellea]|uniref:Thiamine pyrophosphokinase n=1 Tax=Rickenella mellea TaxID=50990 RepID=A0A4Y7QEI8_9AGAM|nr:thiamine pyrophosphokinase [Rickenella mellea]